MLFYKHITANISEVYGVPLDDEVARYWYKRNLETKMGDPTPEVGCNEANIIQNSWNASNVALQVFSKVLDGDRELRYFGSGHRSG